MRKTNENPVSTIDLLVFRFSVKGLLVSVLLITFTCPSLPCSQLTNINFKYIPVNKDTTALAVIEKALRKFGLDVSMTPYWSKAFFRSMNKSFSLLI